MYKTLIVFCLFALALASVHGSPLRRNRYEGRIYRVENNTHITSTQTHVTIKGPLGDEEIHVINRDEVVSKRLPVNGWMTSAWTNPDSTEGFSYFDATWIVPPAPKTNSGKNIIFFFNSVESNPVNDILQPVLQFNNGVAGWTLASWYGVGNNYYEATPIAVSVGDTIRGYMYINNNIWYIEGYQNGKLVTTMSVATTTVNKQYYAQWANENYNIVDCTYLPPSPYGLSADKIVFKDLQNSGVNPSWYPEIYDKSCNPRASGNDTSATLNWSYN